MKNSEKGSTVPNVIAIIALLILFGGFFFYSQNNRISQLQSSNSGFSNITGTNSNDTNVPTNSNTESSSIGNRYTFKSSEKDVGDKLPMVSVVIYENGGFVKSVSVGEGTRASNFVMSPDNSKVAFTMEYYGGTCVAGDILKVVDIKSFSPIEVKTNEKDYLDHGTNGYIISLKWISNDEVLTNLKYGDGVDTGHVSGGCGLYSYGEVNYTLAR